MRPSKQVRGAEINKKIRFELALILSAVCVVPALPSTESKLFKLCAPQENVGQVMPIEPGKPVEHELRGGEKHTYEIHVDGGLFLHSIVEQLGVDVVLTLYAPDGTEIASMNSPTESAGLEQISMIAETSGTYRLELASGDTTVPVGRYRITINPLQPPRDEDRGRIKAERLFSDALKMWVQGNSDSYEVVIQKFEDALPLWHAVGDIYEEALVLRCIGGLYGAQEKSRRHWTTSTNLYPSSALRQTVPGKQVLLTTLG